MIVSSEQWRDSTILKHVSILLQTPLPSRLPLNTEQNSNCYIVGPCSEKAMAPHSSTLAWKLPWTEEPGKLQSMGSRRVRHDWTTSLSLSCTGEGNGNPLQCSCLENPRDGGAWWAAVYGVTQSWTRRKRLSSSSKWKSPILLAQDAECDFIYVKKVYVSMRNL